ncbi:MAG: TolC family protein [Alphaproteobacteria bacterium]|nr:TolC family protein [Alphaproteobacteria bacterium]
MQFALKQASAYQQAQLSEQIAAADVKQARIALLPRINSPLAYTYNTPSNGTPPAGHGMPTPQSFINLNAVSEYQAFLGMTGEVDVSGRLRATIRRNQALLEAAHAGTEIARRALVAATVDAYYGLALATARRRVAELSLASAQDFERATALLLSGGEVASVDLVRARLQTAARRDELEQAHAAEAAAADGLRILVGYDFSTPIAAVDLLMLPPQDGEIEGYTAKAISRRPEFAQFEAERRAAEEDIKIARAERRPQVTYTFNGGFDSDSVYPTTLRSHTGVSGAVNVTVPLFDFGASRSRELQARLRAEQFNNERIVALRNFAQQFYAARSQALTALTRINLVRASVVDAERNLQTSIARYRAGEAPILEVTDAQSTLSAQRTALYQAIYDYQTARAHLAQAVGQ